MKTPTLILIAGLTLATISFAVDPPPDGGYPGANTAEGDSALFGLTSGGSNTAVGYHALFSDTTGSQNSAYGATALQSNIAGSQNTATGDQALMSNTIGNFNTANGLGALGQNTAGNQNTASSWGALALNTTGSQNTASGAPSLQSNSIGSFNTANGVNALEHNTSGNSNTALGYNAGTNLTTGNDNIDIGNDGVAGESGIIRVGTVGTQSATFIAGIRQTPIAGGIAVGITADGQLGVRGSSARLKEAVEPMDQASEAILRLKPVTFRYKKELDSKGGLQFGLVAEEVAKVTPDLVVTDDQGKPFTVRYEEVNAMLLNEFLKEHKKVEEQASEISSQKKELAELKAALKNVTARLDATGF